jgi:hypothetical protein
MRRLDHFLVVYNEKVVVESDAEAPPFTFPRAVMTPPSWAVAFCTGSIQIFT